MCVISDGNAWCPTSIVSVDNGDDDDDDDDDDDYDDDDDDDNDDDDYDDDDKTLAKHEICGISDGGVLPKPTVSVYEVMMLYL